MRAGSGALGVLDLQGGVQEHLDHLRRAFRDRFFSSFGNE